jgi:hypothetical protein
MSLLVRSGEGSLTPKLSLPVAGWVEIGIGGGRRPPVIGDRRPPAIRDQRPPMIGGGGSPSLAGGGSSHHGLGDQISKGV